MYRVIKRTVAVAMLVAAIAALTPSLAGAHSDAVPATANNSGANAATADVPASLVPDPTIEANSSGFEWGDAAIGAAAMLMLLGLAGGTMLVARHHQAGGHAATS